MSLKRFLAFAGQRYYADGGWGDLRGDFDVANDARGAVLGYFAHKHDTSGMWGEVIDTEIRERVEWLEGDYKRGDPACAADIWLMPDRDREQWNRDEPDAEVLVPIIEEEGGD